MKLKLRSPISVNRFLHIPHSKVYTTEASDGGKSYNFWQRIYDDACDVGFQVINPGTGVVITVTQATELSDGDEITGWEFTPTYEDIQRNPKLEGYKFVIYND